MNLKTAIHKIFTCGLAAAMSVSACAYALPLNDEDEAVAASDQVLWSLNESVATPDVTVYVDGKKINFDTDVRMENERIIVPMRAIFEALGAEVEWDEVHRSASATIGGITITLNTDKSIMNKNSDTIELDTPARMSNSRMLVPIRAISEAFGSFVDWDENTQTVFVDSRQNPMSATFVTDDYRYANYDGSYNNISVFDRDQIDFFGMELLKISDEQGTRYAQTINNFAASAKGANVYNLVAPTAAEFYAKNGYNTHYTSAIHKIYSQLDFSITGINAVKPLMTHANENIYFHTDHHWTQLGAYYAYQAFVNSFGDDIAPPYTFDKQIIEGYNGSLTKFTEGTPGKDLISMSPDTLELYMPKVSYYGRSFNDMEMTDFIQEMDIINPGFKNYSCFIEGDYPIEVFDTSVNNGRSLVIIKESYGNSFATWAINNFQRVYIVDYRKFNYYGGNPEYSREFKISKFHELTGFTDLLILNYPISVTNDPEANALRAISE